MRRLRLIVGLAIVLLVGAAALTATGLRLTWEEARPPPSPEGQSASSLDTFAVGEELAQ